MNTAVTKAAKIKVRHARIRAKVSGTAERPRLSVYKSNTAVYGQLVNDALGATLVAYSTDKATGKSTLEKSKNAGKEIAKLALAKGVKKVVFDRGGFIYTGKIKAFADGAREGGLQF